MTETASFRLGARLLEAAVLSVLAGVFVWLLGAAFFRPPLLASMFVGFLSGGAATMRTLGVTLYDRRRRMLVAGVCAVLAMATSFTLDYQSFIHHQRQNQSTADYRATPTEIDQRIAAELRELTGHDGARGYCAAAFAEGVKVVGVRLSGFALLSFWMLEWITAMVVAVRWAGGPRPTATQSTTGLTV